MLNFIELINKILQQKNLDICFLLDLDADLKQVKNEADVKGSWVAESLASKDYAKLENYKFELDTYIEEKNRSIEDQDYAHLNKISKILSCVV